MKQINRLMLVVLLLLSVQLFAAEKQALKMKIEGMTCGMCEAKVKKQLSSVCKEVVIDREKGEGVCSYQAPVTVEQILSEANKTGFKTTKLN